MSQLFKQEQVLAQPQIEDLLSPSFVPENFVAWPFIDSLFDFTKIVGKKKL